MNRSVAFVLATATLVSAAAVALAGTAVAAPNSGHAADDVCVVHQPNNSWSSCLDVTVDGWIAAGRAYGQGSIQVDSSLVGADQIAKIQIDRVAVGTQHTAITSSGPVNGGSPPHPVNTGSSAPDPYYANCATRYHVELDYAVRLTNGQLKTGSFVGPWFDSSAPACSGGDYQPVTTGSRCLTNGGSGGCVQLDVSPALSNDGKAFYARGTISVPYGRDAFIGDDQIARVQVDQVVLGHQSAGVMQSPTMNSRDRLPLSAMGQTPRGFAWAHECQTHYQAALYYSVRMKDGRLFTGRLATPLFKAPGC